MNKDLIEFIKIFTKEDLIEMEIYDEGNFYELSIRKDIDFDLNPIEGIDFKEHYTVDDYTGVTDEGNKLTKQVIKIIDKYLHKHDMVIDEDINPIYLDPWEPEISGQTEEEYTYELEKNDKTKRLYQLLMEEL